MGKFGGGGWWGGGREREREIAKEQCKKGL